MERMTCGEDGKGRRGLRGLPIQSTQGDLLDGKGTALTPGCWGIKEEGDEAEREGGGMAAGNYASTRQRK
jgi:hypothetical protein